MNATIRKFYSLPGIWQLWSIPVLSSVFTSGELRAQAKAGQSKLPYVLFMTLAVIELGSLVVWYGYYFTNNFASLGSMIAGGLFLFTALILIVTTMLYAKRHKRAFRAFLVKLGFAAERPELLATAES